MKRILSLLVGIIALASCSDHESLFDSERVKEEAKENFPVKDIDPNQDWNMATVGTLSVSIHQNSGEVYTVKVYTDNPLTGGNDARLITKKEGVKDGETFTLTFDMPGYIQYVYVVKENSTYNRSIRMVDMSQSHPSVSWGEMEGRNVYAASRASGSNYEKPDESVFPTEIPKGAREYKLNGNLSGNICVTKDNASVQLNEWGSYSIYIKAQNVKLKGTLNMNCSIYIMEGSTVTFDDNLELGSNTLLSLAAGATLNSKKGINGEREKVKLYNRGEIDVQRLSCVRDGYLYNEGTLKTTGSLSVTSDNVSLINLGDIMAGSISTTGTPYIYNGCKMDVSGAITFGGASATLVMDGGTYLKCNTLDIARGSITLGAKAMLVCDYAKMGVSNVIRGVGESESLFYVNEKVSAGNDSHLVTYSGNLWVACHEGNHFGSNSNRNYLLEAQAEMIERDEVHIPEGSFDGCSPGFSLGTGEPGEEDTPQVYTFAFEDITAEAGDYDFNDVVIKVETVPTNGKQKVYLIAAGATKELKVCFGGRTLFDGQEIHAAFGCTTDKMVNTGSGPTIEKYPTDEIDAVTLAMEGNFYITDVKNNINVHIPKFDSGFNKGDVPYALMVPADWDYPSERESVLNKYGDKFKNWAQDAKLDVDWYVPLSNK